MTSKINNKLVLINTWMVAEPWRVKAVTVSLGVIAALALAAGLVPQEVALAGMAVGGSR